MDNQLTCVKGATWHPGDNDVAPHCPPENGSFVLKMENGIGVWLPFMEAVDTGVVWPFYGYESEIAEGWTLCNGEGTLSNGRPVPDMRQRFLMMAENDEGLGNAGGNTEARTTAEGGHTHAVTVQGHRLTINEMPAHSHIRDLSNWKADGNTQSSGSGLRGQPERGLNNNERTDTEGGGQSHRHGSTSSSVSNHAHNVATIPPFYALAFIIKR